MENPIEIVMYYYKKSLKKRKEKEQVQNLFLLLSPKLHGENKLLKKDIFSKTINTSLEISSFLCLKKN